MRLIFFVYLCFFSFSVTYSQEKSIEVIEKDTIVDEGRPISASPENVKVARQRKTPEVKSNFHFGKLYKDLKLLKSPTTREIRGVIEAGSQILKVDDLGKYSLICFGDLCGYVRNSDLKNAIQRRESKDANFELDKLDKA